MALTLGGSSGSSSSSSDSQSSGFSTSVSGSEGASQSSGFDISSLFDPQSEAFTFLFQAAQDIAQQQLGDEGGFSQDLAGDLGAQGQDFLSQLTGASNPFLEGLDRFTGEAETNALVDQLSSDILGDFQKGLVPIGEDAAFAGARGGSRQGVAQGLAAQGATDAFARESANIRSAGADRQLEALLGGGALANDLSSLDLQGALGGLDSLGGLFDLGLGGLSGAFSPLESLAGLVGPILESESGSQATATDEAFAASIAADQSTSTSSSKSKDKSFNIGF